MMKLLILMLTMLNCSPKEETIKISKTYEVASAERLQVIIKNVHGSVKVLPSSSGKVELDLEIKIQANSDKLMALAKRELELGEYVQNDTLAFYTKAPFIQNCDGPPFRGFNWSNNPDYDFTYEYVVRIPKNSMISASTVNKGAVLVENIQGEINVGNINGSVEVKNAHKIVGASSVNGDITINFIKPPKESTKFHTVNGDFNFILPADFAAKVFFQTMHGEIYSAFDYTEVSPQVEISENRNGTRFKIESKSGVEIGSNGPVLNFSSINGNVYLKKENSGS